MVSSRKVVGGILLSLFLTGLLLEIEATPNGPKKTHADDQTSPFRGAHFYRGSEPRALLGIGSSSCSSKKSYTVKKGDTCPALLAKYFHCSNTVFKKFNNNNRCTTSKLYVGLVICLPTVPGGC
eukprot:TRINITY_DN5045_c0_g1_i1.p1 TRINITY_DN5045_c0_g1~~TRINITY_DN5045_c0_g1_i1.p1  ORF type:complete len:124 (+),score=4.64 TRINITY_DN5045_c0_g1_i1:169-540(+)